MYIPGKISISRASRNDDNPETIRIEIIDENSLITFAQLEMSPQVFGEVITGLSHQPCTVKVRGLDLVGKHRQRRVLNIELPEDAPFRPDKDYMKGVTAPYEVDGWQSDGYFGSQGTFYTTGDGQSVAKCAFLRWVTDEATK